jgi:ferric-dicitrate binding protein FerR (iron transport regulator)
MSDQPSRDTADEDYTVRLLRLAGSRPSVSDERTARVRAAVYPRWQTVSRRRTIRRRSLAGAMLLAAAAVLFVMVDRVNQLDPPGTATGEVAAVVERLEGKPLRTTGNASTGPRHVLSLNDPVRTGEWIETDGRARVAVRFQDGSSVRLDLGSRARALSPSVLELSSGAVYVDTGRSSGHFEVRTAVATAHDVGTQFEVRLIDLTLRLRVRTGVVELRSGTRSASGRGGTEVMFSAARTVSRPIAPHGPDWNWMASLAPPVEMEGVALSAFLDRIAREHGWEIRDADAALAREATGIVLHGSVNGLPPREALDVAITTSGLEHRLEDGELTVFRGSAVKKPL